MNIRQLSIGGETVPNNIFLAPMAGYTDHAFRSLEIELGAGLTFTELVSAKGICYGGRGTTELLYCGKDAARTAVQIFGADPYYMRKAIEEGIENKIVDINMGCPVPKVYKNGEGSALLCNIKQAEAVIKECVKSGKIITVKIRTGLVAGDNVAAEFTRMAEASGASLVTVHGRVREAYYSGEPDYGAIAEAVSAVKIPVIANGGIFNGTDADLMMERTGAAGVMLARGAVNDPFLIASLAGVKTSMTLKEFITRQLALSAEQKGDVRTAKEFRKFAPCYFKGRENSKEMRVAISKAESTREILDIIDKGL